MKAQIILPKHQILRRIVAVSMLILAALHAPDSASASTTVNISGTGAGRIFEGEGVLSGGGGNTKLLKDYPDPYRSEILDYLFKPNFGASYPELKVEIGGDINSTSGTEPSHARSLAENSNPNMVRGYETWLISEAKKRNPNIRIYGLQWGAPGWVGNMWSQANADYLASYCKGLKSVWGINVDYIGGNQNENFSVSFSTIRNYIVNILRPTLDSNGLSGVKIIAPDILSSDWNFCGLLATDPALKSDLAAIGYHYVNSSSTSTAQTCGLPIWESEGWTGTEDWSSAFSLAKELNLNYVKAKLTKTYVWHLICSQYNNADWPHSGLMEANTPWSGHYIVQPPIWIAAHVNQFAQPGWQYLDGGCGTTSAGSSYTTFKKPGSGDYSIVIVSGGSAETLTFNLSGGLSTGTVHVWMSNSNAQFARQSDISVSGGSYSINLAANSTYSLTTTTGQQKGVAADAIPSDSPFPYPYSENFESYPAGQTPKYTYDLEGAYETCSRFGGGGQALRQVILQPLIPWNVWGGSGVGPSTCTEFGDLNWTNYNYSADILIENSGMACIYGRLGSSLGFGHHSDYNGYRLSITDAGSWTLAYGSYNTYKGSSDKVLATGTVSGFSANTWHNLAFSFSGTNIIAYIDNNSVASVVDSTRGSGLAGLGTAWNNAQFDNLAVSNGVTGLTAIAGNVSVALSWNSFAGATSYHVKRSTVSGGPYATIASPATNRYTDTGVVNGTTYYYVVSAVTGSGETQNSAQVSATPNANTNTSLGTTADAYVRDGSSANTNFGSATTMAVKSDASGYNRHAFMTFDTSSVSSVSKAVINLYVANTGSSASRTITVYAQPTTTWGESTITWNNAPAPGSSLGTFNVSNTSGIWYTFDVTSYVQSQRSAGHKVVSFELINNGAADSNGLVNFATKEATTGQPVLTITP